MLTSLYSKTSSLRPYVLWPPLKYYLKYFMDIFHYISSITITTTSSDLRVIVCALSLCFFVVLFSLSFFFLCRSHVEKKLKCKCMLLPICLACITTFFKNNLSTFKRDCLFVGLPIILILNHIIWATSITSLSRIDPAMTIWIWVNMTSTRLLLSHCLPVHVTWLCFINNHLQKLCVEKIRFLCPSICVLLQLFV